MPITDIEYLIQEQDSLISTTDLKGIITYANDDFVRVSGYTRTELIGVSYNIMRHPDMPQAVFADLWKALKEGRPWIGLIKNSCKKNGFYWVVANVTPYYENDKLAGYMSIHSKPSREQIATADNAYRRYLADKTGKLRIENGKVVKASFLRKARLHVNNTKFSKRFIFFSVNVCVFLLILGGASLQGMSRSNQSLKTVYQDRVLPLSQLSSIKELLQNNYHGITSIVITPTPEAINEYAGELEINSTEITVLWAAYSATLLTSEEKFLAAKFIEDRKKWREEALIPTLAALKVQDFKLANTLLVNKVNPLIVPVKRTTGQLMQLQLSIARQEFELAQPRYESQSNLVIGVLILGFMAILYRLYMFQVMALTPLKSVIKHFSHIAQGRYDEVIDVESQNDLGLVMAGLKSMQIQLKFEMEEKKRKANENLQIKIALDSASTGVLIADNARNIIYVNKAAVNLFDNAQADIQKQLPKFSVAQLLGANIDDYHLNPMHQAQLLPNLTNNYAVTVNIGGRSILINVSPVINELGQRLGSMVEWRDRTVEARVEQEVVDIMQNILAGDFSQRITLRDKEGFIKQLAVKLNRLFDSNEESIKQWIQSDNALIKLSLAVEQSSSSVMITDIKGDIEYVNQAFVTISGYSRDEVIGQNPRLLQSGKTPSETYGDMWAVLNKGDVWEGEIINRSKHGVEYVELIKITPIRQLDGKVTHYLALKDDITRNKQVEVERQKLEQELLESYNFNVSILDSLTAQIAVLDAQGIIVADNQAWRQFGQEENMQASNPSLLGVNYLNICTDESSCDNTNLAFAGIKQVLAGELASFHFEYQCNTCHQQRWYQMNVSLMQGSNGGVVVSHDDISERKHAEIERSHFLEIIMDAPDFISTSDMQGHINFINRAGLKMVGLPEDAALSILEIREIHPDWAVKLLMEQGIPAAISQGFWRGDTALLHQDGHEIPVSQSVLTHKRDTTGNPGLISTIIRDMTQSKEVELSLRAAKDAAEQLAKAKAQFLANMSHEIRTPMSGIIGFSELALLKEMPADIRDYLAKINSVSTSLLGILNDILDLSKLDAGAVKLNPIPFEVTELKDTLHNLFRDTAQQKGLLFTIDFTPDIPSTLIGDNLRLQQVLINLLGNAIKFTASGSVSLSITLLASESSEVRLLFCVKDTGIGLSAKDQAKLFLPFSQVDDSITRRFGGTGLGLALSHNLVQLMDSQFIVDSSTGLGSSFSFELVLGVAAKSFEDKITPAIVASDLHQQLAGTRILVAEDNLFNQQIVMELLIMSGVSVEIANNGVEALAMLELSEFDAVLMDVHMPVMDGFEATKQIRKLTRYVALPVIALTAGVTLEEHDLCLDSGMNDFIGKPINTQQLLSTLAHWIKPALRNELQIK